MSVTENKVSDGHSSPEEQGGERSQDTERNQASKEHSPTVECRGTNQDTKRY
jgi:hypothetical protein